MKKMNFVTGFLTLLIVMSIVISGCSTTKPKEIVSSPTTKTKEPIPIQSSEPHISETTKKFLTYDNSIFIHICQFRRYGSIAWKHLER